MALQSQTHANLQSSYYIRGADPIVPGDQAIIGPVEILPGDTSTLPAYYNRFNQTNDGGLFIGEFKTAGNELLSGIQLDTNNNVFITSQRPGEEAVLQVGVNPAGDAGRVTINANDGLVVNNLAGAGKGLQIYHDGPTNQNFLETLDGTGAKIAFQGNTGLILISNDITTDKIAITQNTDLLTMEKPGVGTLSLTSGGVGFTGSIASGRVGPFNGASVLLDSTTSVSIRTNTGGSANTAITANQNGTVNFLSTITAPTGNILTINSITGNISTVNSITTNAATVNTSTINAITGNISTINSTTINNTGNARIASVAVTNDNTGSSVPYSTYYGNYQGNLRYNTIRDTAGAPATAIESLEIINVSGGPQTGGIQFYTANNGFPNLVKWMGGFLQNNVGGGQSQFVLPASVQGSIPQLVNVSTINNVPVEAYGTPVGTIIQFAAWIPPTGYLRCDGSFYSTATYPRLYSVIGNTYGGDANLFNVPDCLGKTMMGALATYSPGVTALRSIYTASAIFQGVVTGVGGDPFVNTGLWFSSSDKPITPGMIVDPPGGFTTGSYRVLFVIAGNGRTGGINNGFLVMFPGNIIGPVTLLPGNPVLFRADTATQIGAQYPTLGNQEPTSLGIGNLNIFQAPNEVGSHRHGGTPNTRGGLFIDGAPEAGRGGLSDVNQNIYSFTSPAYTSGGITYPAVGITAPKTMNTIPYNLGVTMCIKF